MTPRRLAGQVGLALVLAVRHRRRPSPGAGRGRSAGAGNGWSAGAGRGRSAGGFLVAAVSPLVAGVTARRNRARWRRPSPAGLALVVTHAASVALAEELLWRAPLLRLRTGPARAVAAVAAGAGFVGLHLRRDGWPALPVHALNTTVWTASTLLGRRLRWPVLAHAGYDLLALGLSGTGPPP